MRPGVALGTMPVTSRAHRFHSPCDLRVEVARPVVLLTVTVLVKAGISFDETCHRVSPRNVCFRRYPSVSIFLTRRATE